MDICYVNLWINEERYCMLSKVDLTSLAEDVLAGMKLLSLPCTAEQKVRLIALYPEAKYDSATTNTIELLPAEVKARLFDLVVQKGSLDIMDDFLNSASKK
jgi:hypothetical protein